MIWKRLLVTSFVVLAFVFSGQRSSAQTLNEILQKHMEALGGEKALKALGNSIVEYEIIVPGGLTGTDKYYFKYPDKFRSETDLKVMKIVTVYDGEKGWILDPNGQVRELAGIELEDVKSEIYFNLYAYLFSERAKGRGCR